MIRLRSGYATDAGMIRTINQDRLLVIDEALYAVADGMGGHRAGEVAAEIAVLAMAGHTEASASTAMNAETVASAGPLGIPASTEALVRRVTEANEAVLQRAHDEPELSGMGTTLAAFALVRSTSGDDLASVVNVGDSRVYRLRSGELEQLTEDHSVIAEYVRSGRITAEEAKTHKQRSILTRALGVDFTTEPDTLEVLLSKGDRLLLCSDGLYGEVPDPMIGSMLRRFADPGEAARSLVREALDRGGRDNVSVLIVDVVDDGDLALLASQQVAPRIQSLPEPHAGAEPLKKASTSRVESKAGVPRSPASTAKAPRRPLPINLRVLVFLALLAALGAVVVWAIQNAPNDSADVTGVDTVTVESTLGTSDTTPTDPNLAASTLPINPANPGNPGNPTESTAGSQTVPSTTKAPIGGANRATSSVPTATAASDNGIPPTFVVSTIVGDDPFAAPAETTRKKAKTS